MTNEHRIQQTLNKLVQTVGSLPAGNAFLGRGDGTGRLVPTEAIEGPIAAVWRTQRKAYVNDGNGLIGLAILDQAADITYRDYAALATLKLQVELEKRGGQTYIKSIGSKGLVVLGGETLGEKERNAAYFTQTVQINLLRLSATNPPSLYVQISAGPFYVVPLTGTQNQWPGGFLEITASQIPSTSGQHRIALVQLNKETNQVSWVLGTAVTANATLPSRSEFGLGDALALKPGTNCDASGYVYLYYGMGSLVEEDIYRAFEARRFLASPDSLNADSLYEMIWLGVV